MIKQLFFKFLLLTFSVLLCLGAAELYMRLTVAPICSQYDNPLYDRSPFAFTPEDERFHPWAHGCPNPYKVAVIGDSFTTGQRVGGDDNYGARLERLLNLRKDAQPISLEVFAQGGTSTYNQLAFLKQAQKWGANLVILGMFINDTEDFGNYAQLKKWRQDMLPQDPPNWLLPIINHSRIIDWIYSKLQDIRCRRGTHLYYQRLYADNYTGLARYKNAIREFRDTCKSNNMDFIVVIWPFLSELGKDYPFHNIHQKIHQFLTEEHITYTDLLDDLIGRAPVRMEVIPGGDGHPSEIAHRLAAESIFISLIEHQLISTNYLPQESDLNHGKAFWINLRRRIAEKK